MIIPSQSSSEKFLSLFAAGDFAGVVTFLEGHPEIACHNGYAAHPLLKESVDQNDGHCYRQSQRRIADLLTLDNVRFFREAVLRDQVGAVRRLLKADANLVCAEFAAGRGIAQPIHHWKSVAVASILLDAGADSEARTTLGETPLGMQARFGTVDGVRFLLGMGVSPDLGSAAHLPSASMAELIELLLSYGWDIDHGQMLHDANHGHGLRVKTWLRYGVNPDTRDEAGQTALHLFAKRGIGRDVIRMLVEAGADINAADREGNTPLDLARLSLQQTAAQVLISLGAECNE